MDRVGSGTGRAIWLVLIIGAGAGLSLIYACATPFAALATLAALRTDRRDCAMAVGLAWLVNQAVGYAILRYPLHWDSFAWGAAIGVAAGVALLAAMALRPVRPAPLAISLPFVGAFTVYETTLYIAGFVLPGSEGAFAPGVVKQLFILNAVAFAGLLIAYRLAVAAGLLATRESPMHGAALSAR